MGGGHKKYKRKRHRFRGGRADGADDNESSEEEQHVERHESIFDKIRESYNNLIAHQEQAHTTIDPQTGEKISNPCACSKYVNFILELLRVEVSGTPDQQTTPEYAARLKKLVETLAGMNCNDPAIFGEHSRSHTDYIEPAILYPAPEIEEPITIEELKEILSSGDNQELSNVSSNIPNETSKEDDHKNNAEVAKIDAKEQTSPKKDDIKVKSKVESTDEVTTIASEHLKKLDHLIKLEKEKKAMLLKAKNELKDEHFSQKSLSYVPQMSHTEVEELAKEIQKKLAQSKNINETALLLPDRRKALTNDGVDGKQTVPAAERKKKSNIGQAIKPAVAGPSKVSKQYLSNILFSKEQEIDLNDEKHKKQKIEHAIKKITASVNKFKDLKRLKFKKDVPKKTEIVRSKFASKSTSSTEFESPQIYEKVAPATTKIIDGEPTVATSTEIKPLKKSKQNKSAEMLTKTEQIKTTKEEDSTSKNKEVKDEKNEEIESVVVKSKSKTIKISEQIFSSEMKVQTKKPKVKADKITKAGEKSKKKISKASTKKDDKPTVAANRKEFVPMEVTEEIEPTVKSFTSEIIDDFVQSKRENEQPFQLVLKKRRKNIFYNSNYKKAGKEMGYVDIRTINTNVYKSKDKSNEPTQSSKEISQNEEKKSDPDKTKQEEMDLFCRELWQKLKREHEERINKLESSKETAVQTRPESVPQELLDEVKNSAKASDKIIRENDLCKIKTNDEINVQLPIIAPFDWAEEVIQEEVANKQQIKENKALKSKDMSYIENESREVPVGRCFYRNDEDKDNSLLYSSTKSEEEVSNECKEESTKIESRVKEDVSVGTTENNQILEKRDPKNVRHSHWAKVITVADISDDGCIVNRRVKKIIFDDGNIYDYDRGDEMTAIECNASLCELLLSEDLKENKDERVSRQCSNIPDNSGGTDYENEDKRMNTHTIFNYDDNGDLQASTSSTPIVFKSSKQEEQKPKKLLYECPENDIEEREEDNLNYNIQRVNTHIHFNDSFIPTEIYKSTENTKTDESTKEVKNEISGDKPNTGKKSKRKRLKAGKKRLLHKLENEQSKAKDKRRIKSIKNADTAEKKRRRRKRKVKKHKLPPKTLSVMSDKSKEEEREFIEERKASGDTESVYDEYSAQVENMSSEDADSSKAERNTKTENLDSEHLAKLQEKQQIDKVGSIKLEETVKVVEPVTLEEDKVEKFNKKEESIQVGDSEPDKSIKVKNAEPTKPKETVEDDGWAPYESGGMWEVTELELPQKLFDVQKLMELKSKEQRTNWRRKSLVTPSQNDEKDKSSAELLGPVETSTERTENCKDNIESKPSSDILTAQSSDTPFQQEINNSIQKEITILQNLATNIEQTEEKDQPSTVTSMKEDQRLQVSKPKPSTEVISTGVETSTEEEIYEVFKARLARHKFKNPSEYQEFIPRQIIASVPITIEKYDEPKNSDVEKHEENVFVTAPLPSQKSGVSKMNITDSSTISGSSSTTSLNNSVSVEQRSCHYPVHTFSWTVESLLLILEGVLAGAFRISENYQGPKIPLIIKNTMFSIRLSLEIIMRHYSYISQEQFEPRMSIIREQLTPLINIFKEYSPELQIHSKFYNAIQDNSLVEPAVPSYRIQPREVNGVYYFDSIPTAPIYAPPRIFTELDQLHTSHLGVFVTPDGLIRFCLRNTIHVDVTLDEAICLTNLKDRTRMAISSNGNLAGMVCPLAQIYQHGQVIDMCIRDKQENKRRIVKVSQRGIHFKDEASSNTYHLKEDGTVTANCEFAELNDDFVLEIFFGNSTRGPEYYPNCVEALHSQLKTEVLEDGSIHYYFGRIKISQYINGHVLINRKHSNFTILNIPELINSNFIEQKGYARLTTPICRMTSTLTTIPDNPNNKYLLVNYKNLHVHYSFNDIVVSNEEYSAGFSDAYC